MALPTRPYPHRTTWPWRLGGIGSAAGAERARRMRPIQARTFWTSSALIRIVRSDAASVAL